MRALAIIDFGRRKATLYRAVRWKFRSSPSSFHFVPASEDQLEVVALPNNWARNGGKNYIFREIFVDILLNGLQIVNKCFDLLLKWFNTMRADLMSQKFQSWNAKFAFWSGLKECVNVEHVLLWKSLWSKHRRYKQIQSPGLLRPHPWIFETFWKSFFSPNGILKNSNKPKGVITDVFSISSDTIGIRWYALMRSILEKTCFSFRFKEKSNVNWVFVWLRWW